MKIRYFGDQNRVITLPSVTWPPPGFKFSVNSPIVIQVIRQSLTSRRGFKIRKNGGECGKSGGNLTSDTSEFAPLCT